MSMNVPAHVRKLWLDGKELDQQVMADVTSITWDDLTDGQDTLTVNIKNDYQKYFKRTVFKKGMSVRFAGGMAGYEVKELFSGPIAHIGATGGRGQSIILHCTVMNVGSRSYCERSTKVYKRMTGKEFIAAMCAAAGLQALYNGAQILTARALDAAIYSGNVRDWIPDGHETDIGRALKAARYYLSLDAAIKSVDGKPTLVLSDPPLSSAQARRAAGATYKIVVGSDVISYQFDERIERHPPESISGYWNEPKTYKTAFSDDRNDHRAATEHAADVLTGMEKLEKLLPPSASKAVHGYRESMLNMLQDGSSEAKAVAEAHLNSIAVRYGENETTGSIVRPVTNIIHAGNWVKVSGVGPYDGTYFIKKASNVWRKSGCTQALEISSKQPSAGTGKGGQSEDGDYYPNEPDNSDEWFPDDRDGSFEG